MSPRIKRLRKVLNPPPAVGFKPYGPDLPEETKEPVLLCIEEYEALRLCDYDGLNHHQASVFMGVSRPTFTRIYAMLRRKMATAFVEGRPIRIEGGKVYFDTDWHVCADCGCYFSNPEKLMRVNSCPLCGSAAVSEYAEQGKDNFPETNHMDDVCICMSCGHRIFHKIGMPCVAEICPRCNSVMRRKRKNQI